MSENFTDTLHNVEAKLDDLKQHITAQTAQITDTISKNYGVVDAGTDSILMWVAKSKYSAVIWAAYTFTAIILGGILHKAVSLL